MIVPDGDRSQGPGPTMTVYVVAVVRFAHPKPGTVRTRTSAPRKSIRLQATVARLYQLSAGELAHVLSTFPLVPKDERDRVYEAYGAAEAPEIM